jgi:6-pyruvoyltetrahydropterin/6-carboxytetrahydropterin synthase
MKMRISREFTFDAAHKLVDYPGKCKRMHGHTYTLVVTVEGEPDDSGMLVDFFVMKEIVEKTILAHLDHTCLNDKYPQPTVENVAQDIFQTLEKEFKKTDTALFSVKLYEGNQSWVEVFS